MLDDAFWQGLRMAVYIVLPKQLCAFVAPPVSPGQASVIWPKIGLQARRERAVRLVVMTMTTIMIMIMTMIMILILIMLM